MWSLIVFDLDYDPIQYESATFLMGDFLRFNPWSRGLGR